MKSQIVLTLLAGRLMAGAQSEIQWQTSFGGTQDDRCAAIIATADGGFLIGGSSQSPPSGNKTAPNYGGLDYWIIKTDANGVREWDRSFGGSSDDTLTALHRTPDGGYILGGTSDSPVSGNKTNAGCGVWPDFWLVKVDSDGNKQWDLSIGGDYGDYLTAFQPNQDGGYFLGGLTFSPASCVKSTPRFGSGRIIYPDYWLVKIDGEGQVVWDRTFGAGGIDELTALRSTPDGGCIIGGYSSSGPSGNKTSPNYGFTDFWVLKIRRDGSVEWQQSYGGTNGASELSDIQLTPDGGYLLAGVSGGIPSGTKASASFGGRDFWLVKIDGNGVQQWDRSYGGSESEQSARLELAADGGALIIGSSSSGNSGNKTAPHFGGYNEGWIVKVDARGKKEWDRAFGGDEIDYISAGLQNTDGSWLFGINSNSPVSGNKASASFGGYDAWILRFAPPPVLNSFGLEPGGGFRFSFSGMVGTNYVLQASSNLVDWASVRTNTASGVLTSMVETNASPARFFRVRQ